MTQQNTITQLQYATLLRHFSLDQSGLLTNQLTDIATVGVEVIKN